MGADLEILIAGAQLTGRSIAYHLLEAGKKDFALIDAYNPNKGSVNWIPGTQGPNLPRHTKMILTPDDRGYSSLSHTKLGKEGARKYLQFRRNGVWLQNQLANQFNTDLVRNLGTFVLSNDADLPKLREEYNVYKDLGFDSSLIEYDSAKIQDTFGTTSGRFTKGLFLPEDFIIDIDGYVGALGRSIPSDQFLEGCMLLGFEDKADHVAVRYKDGNGNEVSATTKKLILATNGFWNDQFLTKEIIWPSWTYVVCFDDQGTNTPNANYFSKNGHYFTRQDGVLLIGGEDTLIKDRDFSTPLREKEALEALTQWGYQTMPRLEGRKPIAVHWGVCAETIDSLIIAGKYPESENVFCLVGCNGDSQASLSYAASLFPTIMGYRQPRSRDEVDSIRLVSPSRPSLQRKIS